MLTVPNELRRGDVVRVRLDPIEGSEQTGERPAVILSSDIINAHSSVLTVAAITSKKTERIFPFDALIEPPDGGLTMRSKVMLTQLRSIAKSRLLGYYGRVSESTMQEIEKALKVTVGLK